MLADWRTRLRTSFEVPLARRERRLFDELNPGLDHSPILDRQVRTPRPASVLIGIRDNDDPSVVMTLRSPTMPSHAGQISLPGGTPKDEDDGAVGTALRETHEEVGIAPDALEVLGHYGPHYGGLGYVVTPVVALIDPAATILPEPREVSEAFEVPLRTLMDPANHVIEKRHFRDVPYNMYAVPSYDTDGSLRNIWGLTAGILRTLSEACHHDR